MGKRARTTRNTQDDPRVVAYLRVSTEEQGRSGLGLEAQRETIRAEAERRGWKDIEYVTDDGYSAKSLDRPAIQVALAKLGAGEADVLVAAKLDRLSRSLLDFASLMEKSRREGWALVVFDLGMDTATAQGELVVSVLASFAAFERRLIAERTSAALQAAKRRGQRLGRPIALPERVRRRIERERAGGLTLREIAERLNRAKVPTVSGKPWGTSSVQKVLKSVALDRAA